MLIVNVFTAKPYTIGFSLRIFAYFRLILSENEFESEYDRVIRNHSNVLISKYRYSGWPELLGNNNLGISTRDALLSIDFPNGYPTMLLISIDVNT